VLQLKAAGMLTLDLNPLPAPDPFIYLPLVTSTHRQKFYKLNIYELAALDRYRRRTAWITSDARIKDVFVTRSLVVSNMVSHLTFQRFLRDLIPYTNSVQLLDFQHLHAACFSCPSLPA
jgi:hypothetical protein